MHLQPLVLLHVLCVNEALQLANMTQQPCGLCLIRYVGTRVLAEEGGSSSRRLAAILSRNSSIDHASNSSTSFESAQRQGSYKGKRGTHRLPEPSRPCESCCQQSHSVFALKQVHFGSSNLEGSTQQTWQSVFGAWNSFHRSLAFALQPSRIFVFLDALQNLSAMYCHWASFKMYVADLLENHNVHILWQEPRGPQLNLLDLGA